jgi:hypothetical protein
LSFDGLPEVFQRVARHKEFGGLLLDIQIIWRIPKEQIVWWIVIDYHASVFHNNIMHIGRNLVDRWDYIILPIAT